MPETPLKVVDKYLRESILAEKHREWASVFNDTVISATVISDNVLSNAVLSAYVGDSCRNGNMRDGGT